MRSYLERSAPSRAPAARAPRPVSGSRRRTLPSTDHVVQSLLDGGQPAAPAIAHGYGDIVELARGGSAPQGRVQMFAAGDSAQERDARSVGDRVRQAPGSSRPLVTGESGEAALSTEGRNQFRPFVGEAVDRARIHVDARADEVADLARARAVTYGSDVFIPRARWSPGSADGRALLGHELAHVAQTRGDAPQMFRDGKVEPHYPTAQEAAEIEKAMGRKFHPVPPAATPAGTPAATPTTAPVLQQGKSLAPAERVRLAGHLMSDFYAELTKLKPTPQEEARAPTLTPEAGYAAAQQARAAVYARFGAYASRNITLTRDETKTKQQRAKTDEVLVITGVSDTWARALARTITRTHCEPCSKEIDELDADSGDDVVAIVVETALRERGDELRRAAPLRVGGSHTRDGDIVKINPRMTGAFDTAVHELIHALAHPAFRVAFLDNDRVDEGFTDYFARQIASGTAQYDSSVSTVKSVYDAMTGPFWLATVGGGNAEESLRLAYFQGRLDLIGWRGRTPDEAKRVVAAGGSAEWDPTEAKRHEDQYRADILAAQDPKRNVLGIGLLFGRDGDRAISVRYARVLARTEYARGQLVAEGQVFGSPGRDPRKLGGLLGIAAEYQEPHFYLTGGVRLIGSGALSGDGGGIDFSPFAGIGIRPWQRIRIGAEGFVLIPLGDGATRLGAGATVGIEF